MADHEAEALRERFDRALAEHDPPFAFVDLDALEANARAMLAQAGGLPIRIASKSVRSLPVLRHALNLDERLRGVLSFTLPEALDLDRAGVRDIFVGYPTMHRAALAELGRLAAERPGDHPALLVDEPAHLDAIEAVRPAAPMRVVVDLDTSLHLAGGRVRIGTKRSPVRTPEQARALAREIERRPGVRLAGAMAYEGHVAGVGDVVPGNPLRARAIRAMQARSMDELRERLPALLAALREHGELELVNCGGTGSLERSAALGVATELTAGSGFYAPALFDRYRGLALRPAAFFCLPVVRRPGPAVATALGGGYVASGAPGADRLPEVSLPAGLRLDRQEGAGEVQTPLLGERAAALRPGDRVYLRHAKAGELCERFDALHLVRGEDVVETVPTYRGEGRTYL